eukprot:gene54361-72643_t
MLWLSSKATYPRGLNSLEGICPCLTSWGRVRGAHLATQAREDSNRPSRLLRRRQPFLSCRAIARRAAAHGLSAGFLGRYRSRRGRSLLERRSDRVLNITAASELSSATQRLPLMFKVLIPAVAALGLVAFAAQSRDVAPEVDAQGVMAAPVMGWSVHHEGALAKLAYGVAHSDQLALMVTCMPGDTTAAVSCVSPRHSIRKCSRVAD